jgi:hypothetical protein
MTMPLNSLRRFNLEMVETIRSQADPIRTSLAAPPAEA